MRRHIEKFVVEILLVLFGALAATLEAVLTQRTDIALIVVLVSLLLALAVAAIRQEIATQIGEAFVEQRIIESIPDSRWRGEAVAELEQLRLTFSGWTNGTRRIREWSSLNFQIESLASARTSVRAIHIATQPGALQMWDDRHRGYDRLVDAFRGLDDAIVKRRILVLDGDDAELSSADGSGRMITSDLAKRVCQLQTSATEDGGLGFELRVLWRRHSDELPPNLLIVDEREVCTIENLGEDRFTDLEVSVNPTTVQYQIRRFEDLWTTATPVRHCLPMV